MSSHSINSQIYRLAVNLALSCTMSDGVWYSIILYDEDRSRSRGEGPRSRLFNDAVITHNPSSMMWKDVKQKVEVHGPFDTRRSAAKVAAAKTKDYQIPQSDLQRLET